MTNLIKTHQNNFESIKHSENGSEFWYARELQPLLGYKRWEDFHKLVNKTQNTDFESKTDHIRYAPKKVELGSNAIREVADYELTRLGCYKVAMLGNTQECIDARSYFAIQTRRQELAQQQINHEDRVKLRKESKESYKNYNQALVDSGISQGQIGIVTSTGDKALFGQKTADIKKQNNIPDKEPLEDYLHPVSTAARMLGREMTRSKAETGEINSLSTANRTHYKHNKEIKELLINNELEPNQLPMLEDIKQVKLLE
jgi:DNA-damage-inducible protein D